MRFAIKSKNVLTEAGLREAIILVDDGKIGDVLFTSYQDLTVPIEDVGNLVVMPGIIDPHIHINEPGRTHWEGFDTATKAAAAGGITTVIDMPLNSSPVTTSVQNLFVKQRATENQLHVNIGFYGGLVPTNFDQLEELLKNGIFGLKVFLTHSGIEEFPETDPSHLLAVLQLLKKYDKPLLVHCELSEPHDDEIYLEKNPRSYHAYLKSRPKSWENNAIEAMINLCRQSGAHVHIVHLSSAESIQQIEKAKKEGLRLTVETAPHYLSFHAEGIADGDTLFKCAPPIRERENNEQLCNALGEGIIDFIATDHSPAPSELKEVDSGNFKKAWGGIAGLQFSLPVVWTIARQKNLSVETISKWMSKNTSTFLKLHSSKGEIKKGFDADLVVWDPNQKFTVTKSSILHKHKITPYENMELYGIVHQTYVGGEKVFDNGRFLNLNKGKLLLSD